MILLHEYRRIWLQLKLRYYRAARDSLTRVNPCHPDLPEIICKVQQLEDEVHHASDNSTAR